MTVTTLRPNGDIQAELVPTPAGSHYACVDESTLDTYDYLSVEATDLSGTDKLALSTFTLGSNVVSKVDLWAYFSTQPATATIYLRTGDTWLVGVSCVTGWNSCTYTGSLTQGQIDDLQVWLYIVGAVGPYEKSPSYLIPVCCMIYADVTHGPEVVIAAPAATGSGAGVAPTLTIVSNCTIAAPAATGTGEAYAAEVGITSLVATGPADINVISPVAQLEVGVEILCPAATINIPHLHFAVGDTTVSLDPASIYVYAILSDVVTDLGHMIYKAAYFTEGAKINRIYVMGMSEEGNPIYGESSDNTLISEYGQVAKQVVSKLITTQADAESIAETIRGTIRLEKPIATIVVPPSCAMEIGDVVQVTDSSVNQSAKNYRVHSYKLVWDCTKKVSEFTHTIQLTEV